MSQRFPPEVHAFIRENVRGRTAEELAVITNAAFGTNFTKETMRGYKNNHKLSSGRKRGAPKGTPSKRYPAEVAAYIQANYKGVGHADMASRLNTLFGTDYTPGQIKSYYGNHKLNSGLTGRFESGHVPENKGKKGLCAPGCERTWFKKGNLPTGTLPLGAVVERDDGYLYKKIADTSGGHRENWVQVHRLIWEEVNGPVPEGSVIIFRDGDKKNCTLDNLTLITRAENAVLNHCGLRFNNPKHVDTGILIAKVKIAVHKRKRRGKRRRSEA